MMKNSELPLSPVAWLALAGAIASLSAASAAWGQQGRVLEPVAQAVQVRGYPVGEGPLGTFSRRREAAIAKIADEVVAARGEPLLREGLPDRGTMQLAYRDSLVVITGNYSNGIICRVDIDSARLREPLHADVVTTLAARSCRAAEERGWGAEGHNPVRPIGSEALPGIPGATVEIHATDMIDTLFPILVRDVEVRGGTVSLLVRRHGRDEPSPRDGVPQWRYAWFADGSFLAVRFEEGPPNRTGRPDTGFACAVKGPARTMPRLDAGPFVSWCDRHSARLRPGLPAFVAALRDYRSKRYEEEQRSGRGDQVPAIYGGFHTDEMPAELVDPFWKTGTVAPPR